MVGFNSTGGEASQGVGEMIPRRNWTRVGCGSGSTLTDGNRALAKVVARFR
jgi:hypothetical protein